MRADDAPRQLRKALARVDREPRGRIFQPRLAPPTLEARAAVGVDARPRVREVEGGRPRQHAPRGGLDLQHVGSRDEHGEVRLEGAEEAVALDDDAGGLHAREGRAEAGLDLRVGHDRPVHVRRARVPVAPRVLARRVGLRAAGA